MYSLAVPCGVSKILGKSLLETSNYWQLGFQKEAIYSHLPTLNYTRMLENELLKSKTAKPECLVVKTQQCGCPSNQRILVTQHIRIIICCDNRQVKEYEKSM